MSWQETKFSIITVCLNAESTILGTICSVKAQTYLNYEYIIWDGLSEDRTLDIIKTNVNADNTLIFTGKDSGLYNAMNQAVEKCNGDYVLFLNSGDSFADENVLAEAADWIEKDNARADIYFGDVLRVREDETVLETYRGKEVVLRLLLAGRMPCHQSIFTKTDIMKRYLFDESYTITADYNFLMKCRRNRHVISHIDRVISYSDCREGISSQDENLEEMRRQDDRSMKEFYPVWFYLLKPIKAAVRTLKNLRKSQ